MDGIDATPEEIQEFQEIVSGRSAADIDQQLKHGTIPSCTVEDYGLTSPPPPPHHATSHAHIHAQL
jgi:hypothetical protein